MAGLCCGKNVVSLVLPDNRSCFVLIELLFLSVVRSAASGSVGFCHPGISSQKHTIHTGFCTRHVQLSLKLSGPWISDVLSQIFALLAETVRRLPQSL